MSERQPAESAPVQPELTEPLGADSSALDSAAVHPTGVDPNGSSPTNTGPGALESDPHAHGTAPPDSTSRVADAYAVADPNQAADASTAGHSVGAGTEDGGGGRRTKAQSRKIPGWVEFPLLIALALVLAIIVKTFVVQAFYIPSGSMEQTLHVGDRVLVNRLSYRLHSIHRGDIVVFNGLNSFDPEVSYTPPRNPVARFLQDVGRVIGVAPPGEKDYIKRVIGLPGDVVACCDARGRVTVNGVALNESYIYLDDHEHFGPLTVPKGDLWVMGDHRSNSSDSRAHMVAVPESKVVGRAFVIIWPLSRWQLLHGPGTFTNPAIDQQKGHVHAPLLRPAGGLAGLPALGVVLPLVRPLRRRGRAIGPGPARRRSRRWAAAGTPIHTAQVPRRRGRRLRG